LDKSLRGTKSLSKRSRCIGTKRARTRLLFHSILFCSVKRLATRVLFHEQFFYISSGLCLNTLSHYINNYVSSPLTLINNIESQCTDRIYFKGARYFILSTEFHFRSYQLQSGGPHSLPSSEHHSFCSNSGEGCVYVYNTNTLQSCITCCHVRILADLNPVSSILTRKKSGQITKSFLSCHSPILFLRESSIVLLFK